MKVILEKSSLKGNIKAIGSKSFAHRYLIASFLSDNISKISNVPSSKDIEATLSCLKSLGAKYQINDDEISLLGKDNIFKNPILNAIESGSTIRFLIPLSLILTSECTFIGSSRLIERGIDIYEDIFKKQNIEVIKTNSSIHFKGHLKPGLFEIDGSISSQYITGLLFALPLLDSDSEILIKEPINSKNYIDITLDILSKYGIKYSFIKNKISIPGNQKYIASNYEVEGDYSNSSFLEAFNYFNSNIKVEGLNPNSLQGDKAYIELFKKLNNSYQEIDVNNCIDLAPILFVFASLKYGGKFTGIKRLAIKESNRAISVQKELKKVGINIEVNDEYVLIKPNQLSIKDNVIFDSHNDHRIAMSLSLLSSFMNITIDGYECVNKSYPTYFKELEKIGGKIRYE